MAQSCGGTPAVSSADRDDGSDIALEAKYKVFLSFSGAQKFFVEQLCLDLEKRYRYPFFDKRQNSLPIGEEFPPLIFDAIRQCHVGVVILSHDFFIRSKWPMMELMAMVDKWEVEKGKSNKFKIIPVYLDISLEEFCDPEKCREWRSVWEEWAVEQKDKYRVNVKKWEVALSSLHSINSLTCDKLSKVESLRKIVDEVCRSVFPETKLKDSHIQGRLRLCKLIREKIGERQKNNGSGVCVVGLYGVGASAKPPSAKLYAMS